MKTPSDTPCTDAIWKASIDSTGAVTRMNLIWDGMAAMERELHAALKRATTEAVKTMRPASIEDKVIDRIRERQATGRAKYGTTMERTDLDLQQWLQHLQEELLDAAVYVEKLKGEIKP